MAESLSPTIDPMALLPAEAIALTVALAQIRRGEEPMPNVSSVCVLALARLAGRYDYTQDQPDSEDLSHV